MLANLFTLYNQLIHVVIYILYKFDIHNILLFMDVSRFTLKVVEDELL